MRQRNPDLAGKGKAKTSVGLSVFYSLSGEEWAILEHLTWVVQAIANAMNCSGCSHSRVLHPQRAVPRWRDQGKEMRCGKGSKNTR